MVVKQPIFLDDGEDYAPKKGIISTKPFQIPSIFFGSIV